MNTKAVDMLTQEHTPEGLLNCARIAYPEYDWFVDDNGKLFGIDDSVIEPDGYGGCQPKTIFFSLDSDSDVLALEDAVLMDERVTVMGHTTWLLDKPWHIEFTDRPEIQAATKTDCLYAAAQEVLEL